MKKPALLFTISVLLLSLLLIACNPDEVNLQTNDSGSSISIELPEETASAISTFGDVNKIYGSYAFPEDLKTGSKYTNGQIITSEGKELLFNSVLVEYNKLFESNEAVKYTTNIKTANSKIHQLYKELVYDPEKIYIEFSTYYNLTDHYIAYFNIRVFDGNFMETYYSNYWYAKSVYFSPDLKYDIGNHINISTGAFERYDWISKTAEPSDDSGSEYNTDGYLRKSTTYYPNGNIHYEWLYDGTESNKLIMRVDYDNSGIKTSAYEYNTDGHLKKSTSFYTNGIIYNEKIYGNTESTKITNSIFYDESGYKTSECEYNENGKSTKQVWYNESSKKTTECEFHENGQKSKQIWYGESGNKTTECEYDENGKETKQIWYDESGNKTSECEYDENGQMSKMIKYNASGNKTSECEYDENGMVTKQIWYDESGNKTTECEFHENGKKSKQVFYDESGNKTTECEYDENGMATKQIWYDESGNIIEEVDY